MNLKILCAAALGLVVPAFQPSIVSSQSSADSGATYASSSAESNSTATADAGTLYSVLMASQALLSSQIDVRMLANSIHNCSINAWPMWICRYADGTVVYNKFRWYRDAVAVTNYFLGRPGSHDCDAYYYSGGRKYSWCTTDAHGFARSHGGIVDIRSIE